MMSNGGPRAGKPYAVDRIIHEPSRYNILALLYVVEEADFLFLQRHTELTPGNLGAHLAKLETAGYVNIRKDFVGKVPRTRLKLTPAGRRSFEEYRRRMKFLLDSFPKLDK